MKIALVTAFYDEDEKCNEYYLARQLSKKGHTVVIYVSEFSVPRYGKIRKIEKRSSIKNVTVVRLKSFGVKRKGMLFLKGLRDEVEKEKFDIVHLQEWFMPQGFQLRKEKNLVLTQRIGKIPFAVKLIFWAYGRKLLKNAKAVTALTSTAKDDLENMGINAVVIPNGVDTELFKPMKHSESKRLRILFVGRLAKEKGVDVLIKACSKLDFDYELSIIGSGDEEAGLRKLAGELKVNAAFLGKKPQEDLPRYYSWSDVLAVPSLKEPFGFITLEAMSCGTPVIGSDIGGMKDVINENTGIKVKSGSSEELANALKSIREKAKELRKNCRDHIISNYSWDVVVEKYLERYK